MQAKVNGTYYAIVKDARKTTPKLYGRKNTVDEIGSALFSSHKTACDAIEFLIGMGSSKYPHMGLSRVTVTRFDSLSGITIAYATNDIVYDTVHQLIEDVEKFLS